MRLLVFSPVKGCYPDAVDAGGGEVVEPKAAFITC